jgi:VWFA-related protein
MAMAAQNATFRSGVAMVPVYATVRDASGHLITDLAKEDFRILDNGRLADVAVFSNDPQPLRVAIMLDTSQSMHGDVTRPWLMRRSAVLAFVDALGPNDRASVGTFGLEIAVGAKLTRDRQEIARVLDEEVWVGGGTPLWQAIRAATTALSHESGRRVVLMVTDGEDTGGLPAFPGGRGDAERQALAQDTMVYAIAFRGIRTLTDELRNLAEATGGGYFVFKTVTAPRDANGLLGGQDLPADTDLAEIFGRMIEELRHQYQLGFVPATLDGKMHTLDVGVTRAGLTTVARRAYLATGPGGLPCCGAGRLCCVSRCSL